MEDIEEIIEVKEESESISEGRVSFPSSCGRYSTDLFTEF